MRGYSQKRSRQTYTQHRRQPSGDDIELARDQNDSIFKSALESIFDKYSRDFTGIADELNLRTGQIVVDNGHLEALKQDWDRATADNEVRRKRRKASERGRSILRAVTVAPEDCDTPISSIEKDPVDLIDTWLEGDSYETKRDGSSDVDSMLGLEKGDLPPLVRSVASASRSSSQDSLAGDADNLTHHPSSSGQNDQSQRHGTLGGLDRSISVDSLADTRMESATGGKDEVYSPNRFDRPIEQAWVVPDIEKMFSNSAKRPSEISARPERPFVLSSVLNTISNANDSQPKAAKARKKRSKSVESDSSEDPLQQP
ncbi:MAG: hypothetical protein Q9160_009250 [Pyrenula sp. 1 TL-2023]